MGQQTGTSNASKRRFAIETLESRVCLSNAIAAATPVVIVHQQVAVGSAGSFTTAAIGTSPLASGPSSDCDSSSTSAPVASTGTQSNNTTFTFHTHERGRHEHMLPGGANYSVMGFKQESAAVAADGIGWGKGSFVNARFDNDNSGGAREYHETFNGTTGGTGMWPVGSAITFSHYIVREFVIGVGVMQPPPQIPAEPGTYPTTPNDGATGGATKQQAPALDQSGSGQTSGAGSIKVGPRASRGSNGNVAGNVIGKTSTTTAGTGSEFVTTGATLGPISTPAVLGVSSSSPSSSSRQALVEVIDTAGGESRGGSGLRAAISGLRISDASSDRFGALANSLGGSFVESMLPKIPFALPTAADIAANLESAAAQAAARVVVTSQPAFQFAHMGSPFALVADSMMAFIEESASTPAVAHPTHSQGPWMLTFAVVAADLVVLTYMHRRGLKSRRRLIAQTA
jgi:hypothetical protein